jgi:hypothetical protein
MTRSADIARFARTITNHGGGPFLKDPATRAALALWSMPLGRTGDVLESFWIPGEHVEPTARIAIVGITPGLTQAENILSAFQMSLRQGRDLATAMRDAKMAGAFSGTLRENLCRMLDHVGLPRWLGAKDTRSLFARSSTLAHFTSVLRHPVFRGGKNYNGAPRIMTTPVLRAVVERDLAAEVQALPNAYWLPLWDTPAGALQHLVSLGILRADRVLPALPHPAGENGENISYFLGTKVGPLSSRRASTGPLLLERRAGLAAFFATRSHEAA